MSYNLNRRSTRSRNDYSTRQWGQQSNRSNGNYNSRDSYRDNNDRRRSQNKRNSSEPFNETPGAAFFVGKLNKNLDRDNIYSALRTAAKQYGFYVKKLDMPYGVNHRGEREGNKGFAFVHTETVEQADKIIRMGKMMLNNQQCEIRAYGGRKAETSGRCSGIDSGCTTGVATPVKSFNQKSQDPAMIIRQVSIELEQTSQQTRHRTTTSSSMGASSCDDDSAYLVSEPLTDELVAGDSQVKVAQSWDTSDEELQIKPEVSTFEFTYENVAPIVYEQQNEALNKGMSELEFTVAYQAWYEHYLGELNRAFEENPQEVASIQYGLGANLARKNNQLQAC